ncbi:MAG: glycosyl hydrolase [Candidatus Kapabacteria bacterium]|nr:glycosyl hydrolase [Ignavibacteriota bacterium]MCW5886142.1 glycosyl hydrolase [Candidatus Kapabacteria bacterium]
MKYIYILLLASFVNCSQLIADNKSEDSKLPSLSGLKMRCIGPALTSGRIGDIAVNPNNKSEMYIAVASGNVFKTTNKGVTFTPIFDNYGSYSIGCVTLDPNNPSVVWIGTGENNSQRSVGWGDGIYKSTDGGDSFKKMGLDKSEHIGKIIVDPNNSNVIYVAAQGPLWGPGGDRGLFKSTDGGKSWEKSLFISDNTGVTDVVIDPRDSKTLYAASYQRRRHVWTLLNGGPEGAVYKSTDAGTTWEKIMSGMPSGDIGRIGLAISPINPDFVYALVEAEDDKSGFFKSTNRGAKWIKQSSVKSASPQYYSEIFCDPVELDKIWMPDTYTKVSVDGGKNWKNVSLKQRHVDDHAIYIDPDNNNYVLIGGDGGLYESYDGGENWRFFENLPVTQFYRIQADNSEPFYSVYGGTQDNNSLGAPARTRHSGGILNQHWIYLVGGDGYKPQIDPKNPNIIYGQWQYGNIIRYDKLSGEIAGIQPQPEKDEELRWNWDTPLIISPHKPERLYVAANKVFMSNDRGHSWTKISDDLTRKIDRDQLKVMDKIWSPEAVAKNQSTSLYGNIISLVESPVKEGLLYIGTDDGLIQVTDNNGKSWTKIESFPGVPANTYVSDIYASRHDENVVYASFNNHKDADFKPYILKSNDKGKTWSSISSDLPDNGPIWTIEEDTQDANLLFAGTEFGLFYTNNSGKKWTQLKSGLPTVAVRDLDIQERETDLVIGTFGRGIYILDDYSPLRYLNDEFTEKDAFIFPIKDALMYIEDRSESRNNEGSTFYRGENHPFGAVFTYYLKDVPKTKKQIRKEEESKLNKEGKIPPYPTFEQLREEDLEESAYLLFTIRNAENTIIRRLKQSPSAGINRIVWDMKYPSSSSVMEKTDPNKHSSMPVVPGRYSVSMELYHNGQFKELHPAVEFRCKPLESRTMPAQDVEFLAEFQQKVSSLSSAVSASTTIIKDMQSKLKAIKNAVKATPEAKLELISKTDLLISKLNELNKELNGDESISNRAGNQPLSISGRIGYIVFTMWYTTSSPTQTNIDSYKIADSEFEKFISKLKYIYENDYKQLLSELDNIGAPWTPDRFPSRRR